MKCILKSQFAVPRSQGEYHGRTRPMIAAVNGRIALFIIIALAALPGVAAVQARPQTRPQTPSTMPASTPQQRAPSPQTASQPGSGAHAEHANHLIHETSPYLLQHAHNPVNWYPWGTEAFETARAQDKPIFLSIGYSTCYWCHVMERESFEDDATAAIMNEHFICIKVDREERPDVDDIYMAAVQRMTGSGGWPMSVFLEPQSLKPFDAGTYFPPQDMPQLPAFSKVLQHAADNWRTQRERVLYQAKQAAIVVQQQLSESTQPVPVGKDDVEKAITQLLTSYDRLDGGFNTPPQRAPKFPSPVNIDFILNAAWDNKPAQKAALFTLDRMAMGGVYDQVGGGFHRYSTDEKWLVPHFEKMLYDNGQLASTYARAFELTKDPFYAQVLRQTLDYVLREMTDASGGAFYSAQDAEVNAHEGENYLWIEKEVRDALGGAGLKDDIDFALSVYGVKDGPNFQDPHHPELGRKNVLFLAEKPAALAKRMGIATDEFNARIERINKALLAVRDKRPQPGKDDKILAAWNGLMIAGMADGGRVLNEKKYKDAAEKSAQFILQKMREKDGGLLRSYRADQAKIPAFLEDYAMMIHGLIAANRATGNPRLLEDAKNLARIAKTKFWDTSAGGYFDTLDGQSDLFVRVKSSYDGAIPSGNSMMLMNLMDLHEVTGMITYLDDATAALKSLSSVISKHPSASVLATLALNRFVKNYPQRLDQSKTIAAKSSADTSSKEPVVISTDPAEITVKPGVPATFTITLRINPAFHLTAHEPGDEFLIPLNVKLTGCEGLKLAIEYPRGDEFKGPDGTNFVYKGTLALPVKIEQAGNFSGQPRLTITYQACTNKECLAPKTESVGVRIIAQR